MLVWEIVSEDLPDLQNKLKQLLYSTKRLPTGRRLGYAVVGGSCLIPR